jgi:hypothetical protein
MVSAIRKVYTILILSGALTTGVATADELHCRPLSNSFSSPVCTNVLDSVWKQFKQWPYYTQMAAYQAGFYPVYTSLQGDELDGPRTPALMGWCNCAGQNAAYSAFPAP